MLPLFRAPGNLDSEQYDTYMEYAFVPVVVHLSIGRNPPSLKTHNVWAVIFRDGTLLRRTRSTQCKCGMSFAFLIICAYHTLPG